MGVTLYLLLLRGIITKMKMRRSCFSMVLACATLLSACNSPPVARVGDFEITREMAETREKVAKVYYPNEKTEVGLRQLVTAYTYAQIMKNYGKPVTDEMIAQEDRRIDTETRDPKTLAKVKAVFGSNHELYLKAFVLPTYVERTIHADFFLNLPGVQSEAKEKALRLRTEAAKRPSRLMALARKQGLTTNILRISQATGLEWDSQKPERTRSGMQLIDQSKKSPEQMRIENEMRNGMVAAQKQEVDRWIREVAQVTPKGALFDKVADGGEAWLVVRSLGAENTRGKPRYRFEVVRVPRPVFFEWLDKERVKVKVEILGAK